MTAKVAHLLSRYGSKGKKESSGLRTSWELRLLLLPSTGSMMRLFLSRMVSQKASWWLLQQGNDEWFYNRKPKIHCNRTSGHSDLSKLIHYCSLWLYFSSSLYLSSKFKHHTLCNTQHYWSLHSLCTLNLNYHKLISDSPLMSKYHFKQL